MCFEYNKSFIFVNRKIRKSNLMIEENQIVQYGEDLTEG